jgi:putative transposase
MSQSLAQIYLHIVFSTKQRRPFLQDESLRAETHRYLAGVCRNLDSPAIIIGGVEDHLHILCRLSRTHAVSELVRELKRDSSRWIKSKATEFREFQWREGYGAFSVSPSHVEALKGYIANQSKHHRRESFQEELRRILEKYGVDYHERYVWD